MKVAFKRTGSRRYAVIVTLENQPPQTMEPAPGYDDDIPHDLVHYVVEAELGLTNGVYGRAARGGGTFRPSAEGESSPRERARKRRKQQRREGTLDAHDATHGAEMVRSERLAGLADLAWRRKQGQRPDPTRSPPELKAEDSADVERVVNRLDELAPLWRSLPAEQALVFEWPSVAPVRRNRRMHPPITDPAHVAQQYADASRLDARTELYRLYSTERESWWRWVFDRLALRSGTRVLEVGSGSGKLWLENAARIPEGVALCLSDSSSGILADAEARLKAAGVAATFVVLDVRALDVESESFDVVIANHVLYHVQDRASAISELQRVLRPGGCAIVTSNGRAHLRELREVMLECGLVSDLSLLDEEFDLEEAARLLNARFAAFDIHRREDALSVTALEPLLAYVRSTLPPEQLQEGQLEELARRVEAEIAQRGAFRISVSAGLVRARDGVR